METGYKAFKTEVIKNINIKENSFGIEPEITVKLALKNYRFYELEFHTMEELTKKEKKLSLKIFYRHILFDKVPFLMAEAVGFEPTTDVSTCDELATRCFKPGSATLPYELL